jgi:hypothetical protein
MSDVSEEGYAMVRQNILERKNGLLPVLELHDYFCVDGFITLEGRKWFPRIREDQPRVSIKKMLLLRST